MTTPNTRAKRFIKMAAQLSAPADDLKVFGLIPITKVDALKQEVWGWAGEEVPDQDGEVMDYDWTKPNVLAWSERMLKISKGKSMGNVRSMHSKMAAGKLIHLEPRDDLKKFWVGAKIVDRNEFEKCAEGVYNGFSWGGNYGKREWDASLQKMRYEAIPFELTLADNPDMYGATFEYVKAAGVTELRKFAGGAAARIPSSLSHPNGDQSMTTPLAKVSLQEIVDQIRQAWNKEFQPPNTNVGMPSVDEVGWVTDVLDDAVIVQKAEGRFAYSYVCNDDGTYTFDPDPIKVEVVYEPVLFTSDGGEAGAVVPDDDGLIKIALPRALAKIAARGDVTDADKKSAVDQYGDVKFADPINKKYPIEGKDAAETETRIRSAWNYINKEKDAAKYPAAEVDLIKGRIVAAWKKHIDPKGPPAAQEKPAGKTATGHAPGGTMKKPKPLNKAAGDPADQSTDPADIIADIQELRNAAEAEGDFEAADTYTSVIRALMDAADLLEEDEDEVEPEVTPAEPGVPPEPGAVVEPAPVNKTAAAQLKAKVEKMLASRKLNKTADPNTTAMQHTLVQALAKALSDEGDPMGAKIMKIYAPDAAAPAAPAAPPAGKAADATMTTADEPAIAPGPKTCPDCGTVNTADAKFCAQCGADLSVSKTAEPVKPPTAPAPKSENTMSKDAEPATPPTAPAPKSEDTMTVVKVAAMFGDLQKTMQDINGRMAAIEALPMPGGPYLRSVSKVIAGQGDGSNPQDPKVLQKNKLAERATYLRRQWTIEPNPQIKAQYANDLAVAEQALRDYK